MMRKLRPFILGFAGGLGALILFSQFSFREADRINSDTVFRAPAIPESLSFAGEPIPLDRPEVREKFDKEFLLNYYAQGNILYLIKLANRNFPIISARLKANGVPDDFKYLCIAESNMQGWAVSKSGAVGYWQFMDGTAPGFGLELSAEVDQRKDLERSTDAACKYLKQAYNKFGNWTAAAASYNCGQGGYASQANFQGTTNYHDLYLPEETNKYIYRIAVFKYLMENSEKLGFVVEKKDLYEEEAVKEIKVSSSIPNLASYAKSQGTNYKVLRVLNPWIKGRSLPIRNGKSYTLRLPAQKRSSDSVMSSE